MPARAIAGWLAALLLSSAAHAAGARVFDSFTWTNQDREEVTISFPNDKPVVFVGGDQTSQYDAPKWTKRLMKKYAGEVDVYAIGDCRRADIPFGHGIAYNKVKKRADQYGYDILLIFEHDTLENTLHFERHSPNVYVMAPDGEVLLHKAAYLEPEGEGANETAWRHVVETIDSALKTDNDPTS